MRRDAEGRSIVVKELKKHMSWEEIWGKKPLRLTLLRGQQERSAYGATYVVFVVVRVQVLVMGRGPQPDPGLARAYSGLDLETSNVERRPPPARCGSATLHHCQTRAL